MVLVNPEVGTSVKLEDYERHYDFKVTAGTIPTLEDAIALEKRIKKEPFKERRKILGRTARIMRELAELSAEETHIVKWGYRQRRIGEMKSMWTAPNGLYVGGLEHQVEFTWDLSDEEKRQREEQQQAQPAVPGRQDPSFSLPFLSSLAYPSPYGSNVEIREGLYTGPLPGWVTDKYIAARDVFGAEHLCVVSRNKEFFKVNVLPREASPMLLGYHATMNKVYLLAAWGLEYELPKSLGGLLDDEDPLHFTNLMG